MTTRILPTDTYYRNYRLTRVNIDTPCETVQVRMMGDPKLICLVPTLAQARTTIDEWHNPK